MARALGAADAGAQPAAKEHPQARVAKGVCRAHMARGTWRGGRRRAASAMAPNRSAKLTRVAAPEPGRGSEPNMDLCRLCSGALARLGSCRSCMYTYYMPLNIAP